jgi:hypothetical protein
MSKNDKRENIQFLIVGFSRADQRDISPNGIIYERKRGFDDLPEELKIKVRNKEVSLSVVLDEFFTGKEDVRTESLHQTLQDKIKKYATEAENQNETSQQIFQKLNEVERRNFYNAICLHVSMGKSLTSNDDFDEKKPSLNNLYKSLSVVWELNRSYLSTIYNLEQLHKEANRLGADYNKEVTAKKYASDLTIFFEANTTEINKIDWMVNIKDIGLYDQLFDIFLNYAPVKWHDVFIQKQTIPKTIKEELLNKIRKSQDGEIDGQKKVDPRLNGRITDSFLSILNPEQTEEPIGNIFEVDGCQYQIFQLFTKQQMKKESDDLGHCIGNTYAYFHAVREDKLKVFSVRDLKGRSIYTIAYSVREKTITQLRGKGNSSMSPLLKDSPMLLTLLNMLEKCGYKISAIREEFNYGIIKTNGVIDRSHSFNTEEVINFLKSSDKNHIIKSRVLKIEDSVSEGDLMLLTKAEGLTLDLTKVTKGLKNIIEIIYGDLIDHSDFFEYKNLTSIWGNAHFINLKEALGLKSLKRIGGNVNFLSLKSARGLDNLSEIGGNANFINLESALGLEKLKKVDGNINFNNLKIAKGLDKLNQVGGYANFLNLEDASGLGELTEIAGNADFSRLESSSGLESLVRIDGDGYFINLKDARGLVNLKNIGINANFNSLKNSDGLRGLKFIGRNANFINLEDASGFLDLEKIGGNADFPKVRSSEGFYKLTYIGGNANFLSLRDSSNLKNLEKIGRHAYFYLLPEEDLKKIKDLNS